MKESDILHESGRFWVFKDRYGFHVMASGSTVSVGDSSYADKSLAIARCDYLARREIELGRKLKV